jgi:hypothetical protein
MTPGTVVLWASSVCAMRALARHGHAWARLGASMPVCVRVVLAEERHGRVQGCERKPVGMVVQAREGQR